MTRHYSIDIDKNWHIKDWKRGQYFAFFFMTPLLLLLPALMVRYLRYGIAINFLISIPPWIFSFISIYRFAVIQQHRTNSLVIEVNIDKHIELKTLPILWNSSRTILLDREPNLSFFEVKEYMGVIVEIRSNGKLLAILPSPLYSNDIYNEVKMALDERR